MRLIKHAFNGGFNTMRKTLVIKKRLQGMLLPVAAMLFLTACGGGDNKNNVSISISPTTANVESGEPVKLTVTAKNTEIIWPADVEGVYHQEGNTVTWTPPVSAGTYEFTVTADADTKKTATAKITVSAQDVSVLLNIETDTTMTAPNTPLSLRAVALPSDASIASYSWTFDDGQKASGREISVSFPKAGNINVTLEATTDKGVKYTSGSILFVADENSSGLMELEKPFGDIDGDGKTTLLDALILAQSLHGDYMLPFEDTVPADLNFDNTITDEDLNLELQAVVEGTPIPSAVLKEYIYPGSIVAIVSPALLEPASVARVKVGGIATDTPLRATPGYASFVVPTELAPDMKTTTIELLINGETKDSFQIPVRYTGNLPANAVEDVLALMAEYHAALKNQQTTLMDLADGMTDSDRNTILAYNKANMEQLKQMTDTMKRLFAAEYGNEYAKLLQEALYANGLTELRAAGSLMSIQSVGDNNCDWRLPAICSIQRTFASLSTLVNTVAEGTCIAGLVAIRIFPAFLPEAVALCTAATNAAAAYEIVNLLPKSISLGLQITASSDANPLIRTNVLAKASICSTNIEALASTAVSIAVGKIILRNLPADAMFWQRSDNDLLNLLNTILDRVAGEAFSYVLAVVRPVVKQACSLFPEEGLVVSSFIVPANRVLAGSYAGVPVIFNSNDTATLMCESAPSSYNSDHVNVWGILELDACGHLAAGGNVPCRKREVKIFITMGDNGSVLDDIFELQVLGRRMTSGFPVRGQTISVMVPAGESILIRLSGRAAPDGVGTYYIVAYDEKYNFLLYNSGTTLVPGVSYSYRITAR
jgi:hypothetical protein